MLIKLLKNNVSKSIINKITISGNVIKNIMPSIKPNIKMTIYVGICIHLIINAALKIFLASVVFGRAIYSILKINDNTNQPAAAMPKTFKFSSIIFDSLPGFQFEIKKAAIIPIITYGNNAVGISSQNLSEVFFINNPLKISLVYL